MSDEKKLTVSRVVDASADDLFDILTLPRRHKEFDGSGMIVSDEKSQRIAKVGDVFTMNMHAESQGGDYKSENHVNAFVPNKVVGWATAKPGQEPLGWTWTYTLEPQGPEQTLVTLEYDWSDVTDKNIAARMPAIGKDKLEESLNLLASAVS